MPDPDDDVELPPSYDFAGGFGALRPDPPPADPPPAAPAAPPAPAAPRAAAPIDPATQPGGRPVLPGGSPPPPPVPPSRSRGRREPSGTPSWGTAPDSSKPPSPGRPAPARPKAAAPRKPVRAHRSSAGRASTQQAPGSLPPAAPRRTREKPWALVAAAVVVVGMAIAWVGNGSGDDGGGGVASPIPVEPDTSRQIWSVDLESDNRLVGDELNGSYGRLDPEGNLLVVGDHVVGRYSAQPYEEGAAAAVSARALADGTVRDLITLERPRCAGAPGALGRGSDLLVCSGVDDGAPVVVQINVASGEEVRRWSVAEPVAMIAVTATGVATLDVVDLDSGDASLRWFSLDGVPAWSASFDDLPAPVRELLARETDEGYQLAFGAALTTVGDGAVLTASTTVVSMDATGVTSALTCWAGSVSGEAFTCYNEETRRAEGRTAAGEVLWSADDVVLGGSFSQRSPVSLTTDHVRLGDGEYRQEDRVLDPLTGRTGDVLPTREGYGRPAGTLAFPVVLHEEEREDYDEPTVVTVTLLDPRALAEAWSVELESRQYPTVVVTGERVLVQVDRGRWTVLDLATGEVVGGMAADSSVAAVVEGGVITAAYNRVQRVELP